MTANWAGEANLAVPYAGSPLAAALCGRRSQGIRIDYLSGGGCRRGSGITIHSEYCEGDEMKGLLRLADQLRPDLLVVGLQFEPGGLSQYLGRTARKLTLHAGCNILGIR